MLFFLFLKLHKVKHLQESSPTFDKEGEDCAFKLFCCSTVWSSTSKKNVKKLQLVQNYASRIVAG